MVKMKKQGLTFIIIFSFFFAPKGYSQYYTISYVYWEIIEYSITITYSSSSGNYIPNTIPNDFYSNALAYKQAKYDANRKRVSAEYGRLVGLQLINENNKKTLQNYKNQIIPEIDNKAGGVDYSYESNTENWIDFISQPFRVTSIKNEIILLQKCRNEITKLKTQYPSSYASTIRYQSISKMLDELENCSTSEIPNLNWEKYETQVTSKNNIKYSDNTNISLPAYDSPVKYTMNSSTIKTLYGETRESWVNMVAQYVNTKLENNGLEGGMLEKFRNEFNGIFITYMPINKNDWIVQSNSSKWKIYEERIYPIRVLFQVKSSENNIYYVVAYIDKNQNLDLLKQDDDPNGNK